jgi:outer membrane protein assembly factor BamE (lipoprotein component of BamABCDE complex)
VDIMRLNFRLLTRIFVMMLTGVLVGVMAVLTGCAIPSAIKPGATAEELTQKLGKPTAVRPAPGGGESWEYAYGPEGTETWLFSVDQGRKVRTSTQLLTEERLRQVVAGKSSEADVRALLGEPRDITRYPNGTTWEWRARIGPEMGMYVVHFGTNGTASGYSVLKDYKEMSP